MKKEFCVRDFIFNNGIVNFDLFLQEHQEISITAELNHECLELEIENDELFFKIFHTFLKEFRIIHMTQNLRWYFDEVRMRFVLDNKFDSKGGQKNDLRNGVYLYKTIDELGLSKEEVKRLFEKFIDEVGKKYEDKNVPNKNNQLIIHITLDQAIERFMKYVIKGDKLKVDSKIHTFEDGQNYFHDMLKQPKDYYLDKWEALIYWFGGRTARFYMGSSYIFFNSSDLLALQFFKRHINIPEDDVEIPVDENETKRINSNIAFHLLRRDGITDPYFYISNSLDELELKFFLFLFSIIYHIEDEYLHTNERRKRLREQLFEALQKMTFVTYSDDDAGMKRDFAEYTRAYWLFQFFSVLKEKELFDYLGAMISTLRYLKSSREFNKELRDFSKAILEMRDFRKTLFAASFEMLKNEAKPFGEKLFSFNELYIQHILKGEGMELHKDAKIVGEVIGHFCANTENKDLLFKLRNVKNFKQLVSFFKDLEFEALKNENEAKFSNEFKESLERVLQNQNDWELARDYIAIYAIDKYRSVKYAKQHKGE